MGWGEIDLLAVDDQLYPAIVELKLSKGKDNESPQRPLFEALAYAIALQENWVDFRAEFDAALATEGLRAEIPEKLDRTSLILLAPNEYWNFWQGHPKFIRAKQSYAELVSRIEALKFPVRFAGIDMDNTGRPVSVVSRCDFIE